MDRRPLIPALLLPLPILLALVVFWPALSGPFLLDDPGAIANLGGADGATDTFDEVVRLVFPQHKGTGRSLSYLSLLINDNAWPTEPAPFKYTNLLLHCLNGVLVFILARMLARLIYTPAVKDPGDPTAEWIALVTMTLWLIHPIQLSPMMLVIQRMTLLAGTFSLLAIIAYVHGRRIAVRSPWLGYVWMVPIFGLCLLLGLLSKDSAAMSIAFVIVLEATILRRDVLPRPPGWPLWALIFLVLPVAVIATYLASIVQVMSDAYANRDFTLGERLMTEARVLMQYLRVILLPSLSETGPFQDDFVPSRGLLDPPGTLASALFIILALGLAWSARRRWPVLAMGVLWFFLGHSLEGTFIPLELYFEHRNYLPMFGIIFAFSYGLMLLNSKWRHLAVLGLLSFIVLEATISLLSARTWGDKDLIAVLWGAEHPASPRAQALTLRYWNERGDGDRLQHHLNQVVSMSPNYAGYRLYQLIVDRCGNHERPADAGDLDAVRRIVPIARYDVMSTELLKSLTSEQTAALCQFTDAELEEIFDLFLTNPRFTQSREVRQHLFILKASYYRSRGDLASWDSALNQAFDASPVYSIPLTMAYIYGDVGEFSTARVYLDKAALAPLTSVYDWVSRDRQVGQVSAFLEERLQTTRVATEKTTSVESPASESGE